MEIGWWVFGVFFGWWISKKIVKKYMFKDLPPQTFDVIHASFGALLATLSTKGFWSDAWIGVVLYLAYQILGYMQKKDQALKDIAAFASSYFGTLIAEILA